RSAELRGKPALTLGVKKDTMIHCSAGLRNRYIWRLRSEDGIWYLFQATSEPDLDSWLSAFKVLRGVDHISGKEGSFDSFAVDPKTNAVLPCMFAEMRSLQHLLTIYEAFGVPLDVLCQRDNTPVPLVVEAMLSEIE